MKKLMVPLKYITNHPLTKNNKISGYIRFIKWQIKSRLSNKSISVNWIENIKLNITQGMHGATGCIYVGLPEFEDMSFLLHYLSKEDLFIDIGSNIGVYSLLAAGVTKTDTIAIEPVPTTYKTLEKNIASNHLENKVKLLNIGLSKSTGSLFFTSNMDTTNHVIEKEDPNSIQVKVETLDTVIDNAVPTNTLIKLDVEGYEYNVLKGGLNTLKNPHLDALIVELNGCSNRFGLSDTMVDEKLTSFGFEKYNYDPFTRKLLKIDQFHREGNTLYLREKNLDSIQAKLIQSTPFTIFNTSI